MTSNSKLNVPVSCFKNYFSADDQQEINLLDWLRSDQYIAEVTQIRNIRDKTQRDKAKAQLPAITPGGLFARRANKELIRFSGLMQLDIDLGQNTHIRNLVDLKKLVSLVPYVAYCGLSVSGTGYWLLVPVKDQDQYRFYFEALVRDWKDEVGIAVDPARKDLAGLRGYSFDPNSYFNHHASYYTKILTRPQSVVPAMVSKGLIPSQGSIFEIARSMVEKCGFSFVQGNRHNYLLRLCKYLNGFGIPQSEAEAWIFSHLPISPSEIKSNCITWPYAQGKRCNGKFRLIQIPFDSISDYSQLAYKIVQSGRRFYFPKSTVKGITETYCMVYHFVADKYRSEGIRTEG